MVNPEHKESPSFAEPSGMPRDISKPTIGLVLLGLILIAGAVRLHDLAGKDMWLDEANTVIISQQSFPDLVARLRYDSSPPLYYMLLHVWMGLFGDGEIAVRMISVLGGVALVVSMFWVGWRLFSFEAGTLAALLVSVAPIQVLYSQQARMYSLLPTVALLSVYFLWRAVTDGRRRYLVAYGIATLAGLYIHNYGIYMLPAHFVVLLASGSLRARWRSWFGCGLAIFLGYLPWVPILGDQIANKTHYKWLASWWNQWGPGGSVLRTLDSFAAGSFSTSFVDYAKGGFFEEIEILAHLRLPLFGLAALLCLLRIRRGGRGRQNQRGVVGLLLAYLVIPLLGALFVSTVFDPNYVPGRCDQLVFPAFALMIGVGLAAVPSVVGRYGFLVVLLYYSCAGLSNQFVESAPNGERAMAQAIASRAREGDVVVCTSLTRAPLQYYLSRAEAPVEILSYPSETAGHLGSQDDDRLLRDPMNLAREVRGIRQRLQEIGGRGARFFVAVVPRPINEILDGYLLIPGRSTLLEHVGTFEQAVIRHPVVVALFELDAGSPTATGGAGDGIQN